MEPRDDAGSPLRYGILLDGRGGGEQVVWERLAPRGLPELPHWLHFDLNHAGTERWLVEDSGLDTEESDGLVADETAPRAAPHAGGVLVTLRGVNLNPGADADDMVAIRIWLAPGGILTAVHRRLMTVADLAGTFGKGEGPRTPGGVLAALAAGLTGRMVPVLAALHEEIDDLEDEALDHPDPDKRDRLRELRRQAIRLRRHLAPQRETLKELTALPTPLLDDGDRHELREARDALSRYVEDLDALRERAMLLQEGIMARQADAMNRNTYVLTIVAGVFLPLGLVTGLLGINVGGMPGADNPEAFWIVTAGLCGVLALEVALLWRLRWF